jgi:hypothetical protein
VEKPEEIALFHKEKRSKKERRTALMEKWKTR